MNQLLIREHIETPIVKKLVADLIAGGFDISVNDGGETTVKASKSASEVLKSLFTTGEDYLLVHKSGRPSVSGWIRLVYGNEGFTVICDYTTNLESIMAGASELADKLEKKYS